MAYRKTIFIMYTNTIIHTLYTRSTHTASLQGSTTSAKHLAERQSALLPLAFPFLDVLQVCPSLIARIIAVAYNYRRGLY